VVLLFGVATSIEIFQDRLPRATLRGIHTTQFDVVRSDELLERMLNATVVGNEDDVVVRLGPDLSNLLIQRQKQNIQSPDDFTNALRVSYLHVVVEFGSDCLVRVHVSLLRQSLDCFPRRL
jgi:origin recognition complex subunit 3